MQFLRISEEVLYPGESIVRLSREDIDALVGEALQNPRQRIRLCSHRNTEDSVHEMLIVHVKNLYVRPHRHLGKSESFHVIHGEADIVVFNDDGSIKAVIRMGDFASGREFYYRLNDPCFHTLIVRSNVFVFHETTRGPFRREEALVAPWAPDEGDESAVDRFLEETESAIGGW